MFCHECGQFLTGKENFCSSCGTKVTHVDPAVKENTQAGGEQIGFNKESEVVLEKPKHSLPDMSWDLSEFSPKLTKKEDPVIFWRTDDMFMGKELKEDKLKTSFGKEDEVSEEENKKVKVEPIKDDGFTVPEIFSKKEEEKKPSFLESLDLFESEEFDNSKEEIFVEAELVHEPVDPKAEIVGKEFVVEQPTGNLEVEIVGDENKEVALNHQPVLTSAILDDKDIENLETIIMEAKKKERVEEEIGISLFDEIADDVVDTLENSRIDEEKKRIDKFYTFNKKKEEFQRLLDKEYERIENNIDRGGLEEAVSGFIDVEVGKEVEGTSQLEEMVKARELFFDSPVTLNIINEQVESSLEDDDQVSDMYIENYKLDEDITEDAESEEEISENARELRDKIALETIDGEEDLNLVAGSDEGGDFILDKLSDTEGRVTFEPSKESQTEEVNQKPEFLRDTAKYVQVPFEGEAVETDQVEETARGETPEGIVVDQGQKGDPARVIIEPKKQEETQKDDKETIGDQFFADEEEHKRSKLANFFLGLLIVLTITVGGLFAIRVAMPTSYISQYIDEVSAKVMSIFKSDTQNEKPKVVEPQKETVEESPSDVKSDDSKDIVEKSVETEKKQQ